MTIPRPTPALDDQLCFALYTASRAMTARYRPELDRLGITYPQLLVLMALWEKDGQTVHELSARLALDSGTTSPLLKRLEAAELVTRNRSTEDERKVVVRLTDLGQTLEQPACGVSQVIIDALGLDRAQFHALKKQLELITARSTTER